MANVIKHKRGSGSDPVANDLVVGEVAIRTDVGKLFTKMDNGSVAEIAGGGSDIAINTLSSSSGTGGGSATFNGSAFRFTLSAPPSVSAQQLLVSINGVIQKPVAGTGQPSEGFSVDGTDIILGAAPATGSDFFILTFKSLGVSEPADNSVTSAKIADGAIVNADINASAAIAGTKIAPDFGSQNIQTTGQLQISSTLPTILLNDTDSENDFEIRNQNGSFVIRDIDNPQTRYTIASSGMIHTFYGAASFSSNLDVGAGLTVNGNSSLRHILAQTDSTYDIGTTSTRYRNVYADAYYGDGSNLTGVTSVGGSIGVDFNDNVKARFGTGNDLEIFHNASNSVINDAGTGSLLLQLGGSTKFELTSTGAKVTGVATVSNGIIETAATISTNHSITSNFNAMSAGPVTVSATITIPSGSVWTIV